MDPAGQHTARVGSGDNMLVWSSFEEIGSMKKSMFLNIIKRKTEHEAMKYLEKLKEKHSKVKLLKHPVLKMQKYLMPNDINMKNEDGQNIFRLRSKMTAVKMNQRNRYENHECEVCGIFDESQEHVLNCKEILEMNEESDISEIPEYNRIFDGTVMEQVKISKIFSKNMKVIENIRRNNNKWRLYIMRTHQGPGDKQFLCVCSSYIYWFGNKLLLLLLLFFTSFS